MDKKLGYVSRYFPRFSKKAKRVYNEGNFLLKKKRRPYNKNTFKRSQLYFNSPSNGIDLGIPESDAISIILFVTKNNPLHAEEMIEERLASGMFKEMSAKKTNVFFDTMNSFEELKYRYEKLYEEQERIEKIWDVTFNIFAENYKYSTRSSLNNYIKFLRKYLKSYLAEVVVRSTKVERHIDRIIDKIIFLKFLKYYKNGLDTNLKKKFFSYFEREKKKLEEEYSIRRASETLVNRNDEPENPPVPVLSFDGAETPIDFNFSGIVPNNPVIETPRRRRVLRPSRSNRRKRRRSRRNR